MTTMGIKKSTGPTHLAFGSLISCKCAKCRVGITFCLITSTRYLEPLILCLVAFLMASDSYSVKDDKRNQDSHSKSQRMGYVIV